jgi:uncharacterized lipoprotein
VKGWAIKVAGRGTSRQAREKEAASLLISALATVAETSGAKTMNMTTPDGNPIALAIIEGARFQQEGRETVLVFGEEKEE